MKFINQDERRLVNAILFFADSVHNPFKTKMFKLLSLLDFIHFNETGRTVTGETYETFPRGPVPIRLFLDIEKGELPSYFKERLKIVKFPVGEKEGFKFVPIPGTKPDLNVFSKRELRILKDLAYMYVDATAEQMIEVTHLKNSPWEKTKNEKGMREEIDIMLALNPDSKITRDEAEERLVFHKVIQRFIED